MTITEFAAELGVTQQSVSEVLNRNPRRSRRINQAIHDLINEELPKLKLVSLPKLSEAA